MAALAAHLQAVAFVALVEDADVGALVPAVGFPQTLPGGPAWRTFLSSLTSPGLHHGTVTYPTRDIPVPAMAWSASQSVMIFIGPDCDVPMVRSLETVIPLLSSILRAEQAAFSAAGELRVAQDHARQAEALAAALDTARADGEDALQQLARQTRALAAAHARAEDAVRAKDEFLAMLGHELRNPLSPILTALQLMRMNGQASWEQEVIERQVSNLKNLVDDLLDVARITGGKIDLRRERIELSAVATRAIELASPLLERKQQTLVVDIPAQGLLIDGDPFRLAQVFANLLTNAAKYSDAGSRVEFAASCAGDRVQVRVRDHGIGLEPEMLDRVFELFVQQRQSADRSDGGLGLGLAIVRSLLSLHGGTVRAQSQGKGFGSEFIVDLPVAESAAAPSALAALSAESTVVAPSAASQRILVVDDNDDARQLLAEALTALGYVVRRASDGPEALRIAEIFKPHVALLDIGLSVMDGYELAGHLREKAAGAALRLIAVTGYGQSSDKRRALAAGFDAHLVKPVALEELVRSIADSESVR